MRSICLRLRRGDDLLLSIRQLAAREGVEMPICTCAYEVLYQNKDVRGVVTELMTRAKKDELLETAWL